MAEHRVEIVGDEGDVPHAGVARARRLDAVGFEGDDIVVVLVEAEEHRAAGLVARHLHAEHVAVEALRDVEVAHPDGHMAGSLDRHGFLLLGRA